jgi:hypothetical protein
MFHFTAGGKGCASAIPRQSPRLSPATVRQKEPRPGSQGINLGLYQCGLAFVLCPQQHSKNACNPQPGTLGRAASVSLVHQNQVGRHLQRQGDGLGLARIESRCE